MPQISGRNHYKDPVMGRDMGSGYRARIADGQLPAHLAHSGAVLIEGARACGKTSTMAGCHRDGRRPGEWRCEGVGRRRSQSGCPDKLPAVGTFSRTTESLRAGQFLVHRLCFGRHLARSAHRSTLLLDAGLLLRPERIDLFGAQACGLFVGDGANLFEGERFEGSWSHRPESIRLDGTNL